MKYNYKVTELSKQLWVIEDEFEDSFYLIEGEEKALLIDTGMGKDDILPAVRSLTKLPVELALTHIHPDHCLHTNQFERVYWSEKERSMVPLFSGMMGDNILHHENFVHLADGAKIDLGGTVIEAFELPGHTPGSLVYFCHQHKSVFTGDAIGSGMGVLMAIPGSLPLSEYYMGLNRFLKLLDRFPCENFYGGHRLQQYPADDQLQHTPFCRQTAEDMMTFCQKILSGNQEYDRIDQGTNDWVKDSVFYVFDGSAAMWLTEKQMAGE